MADVFDWILQTPPAEREGLAAKIRENHARATVVWRLADNNVKLNLKTGEVEPCPGVIGIEHNFACGCGWLEHGGGEDPLRQCAEHLGTRIWPERKLPDAADLFAMKILGDYMLMHAAAHDNG